MSIREWCFVSSFKVSFSRGLIQLADFFDFLQAKIQNAANTLNLLSSLSSRTLKDSSTISSVSVDSDWQALIHSWLISLVSKVGRP